MVYRAATLISYYAKDPIKQAARSTIIQFLFCWNPLNRSCLLNYFIKMFHYGWKKYIKAMDMFHISKITSFNISLALKGMDVFFGVLNQYQATWLSSITEVSSVRSIKSHFYIPILIKITFMVDTGYLVLLHNAYNKPIIKCRFWNSWKWYKKDCYKPVLKSESHLSGV